MAKVGQRGNGRRHIKETPDVSHIKNVEVSHEVSDVNVSPILKFVAGLTVLTVAVYLLVLLLFDFLNHREVEKEPAPGPMAMSEQERLPPGTRLQSAPGFGLKLENGQWVNLQNREPQAEYQVIRDQWDRVLKEGVKDQSGNIVALPIEQAMKKLLQGKGLPSRTKLLSEEGAGWRPEDYGIDMPTTASSGRMTERGKQ